MEINIILVYVTYLIQGIQSFRIMCMPIKYTEYRSPKLLGIHKES